MILVLSGHGSTSVWNDAGQKVTFEWGPGALFSIPLNAWHQHFNASGSEPVRYIGVASPPTRLTLFGSPQFILISVYPFATRYPSEGDYFKRDTQPSGMCCSAKFT